jgi:hypothetical protein
MMNEEQLRNLISIWTTESDGFKAEARRLESSDQSRHATSIEMLETRAQAIDRCILGLETLNKVGSTSKG